MTNDQIPMTKQIPNPNDQTLLLIDMSGDEALVVLARGEKIVSERRWENGPDAGRRVLEFVDELLKAETIELKSVERVAVQAGSGRRYSSLRSGVVVANMLTLALATIKLVEIRGGSVEEMIKQAWESELVNIVKPKYMV